MQYNMNIQELENYLNKIFALQMKINHKDLSLALLEFEIQLNKLGQAVSRMKALQIGDPYVG
jgi:hypothetical protein